MNGVARGIPENILMNGWRVVNADMAVYDYPDSFTEVPDSFTEAPDEQGMKQIDYAYLLYEGKKYDGCGFGALEFDAESGKLLRLLYMDDRFTAEKAKEQFDCVPEALADDISDHAWHFDLYDRAGCFVQETVNKLGIRVVRVFGMHSGVQFYFVRMNKGDEYEKDNN